MTMHQNRTQERKNKRKSTFYPLFGAEQEGIKRVPRKWGVVGSLRQNRCFADDSPLASSHILFLSFYLFFYCGLLGCYGQVGTPLKTEQIGNSLLQLPFQFAFARC